MPWLTQLTFALIYFLLAAITICIPENHIMANFGAATTTPTASGYIPPDIAGPNEKLACPQDDVRGPGPVWRGITVGVSTLDELNEVLGASQVEIRGESPNSISMDYYGIARVCVQHDTVVAISPGSGLPYLSDYVAIYGPPDMVTWTSQYHNRVAFWFEKGFAVSAWVGTVDDDAPIHTGTMILFPFQSAEGFETRWPFNATFPDPPNLIGIGDPVPTAQNPYNFDAMIATITAQPSRTPTPTFTPRPTQTTTPTPEPTHVSN